MSRHHTVEMDGGRNLGFYEILEENNLLQYLQYVDYSIPHFVNSDAVITTFLEIVRTNAKVLIIGDCDVDGLMCNLILREGLARCGCTNFDIFKYRQRSHTLDPVAIQECVRGGYKYCIIADCGSDDIALLSQLLSYGVHVILLDHHECESSYDSFYQLGDIDVINTTLEPEHYCLSAGALCYCVMSDLHARLRIEDANMSVYALTSLYADCMNMGHELNRAIYYKATAIPTGEVPSEIAMFMNSYQRITSRFINFWFSPRINAMFRSNSLDIINVLFLEKNVTVMERNEYLELLEQKYVYIRDLMARVADIVDVQALDTFVIADLRSVEEHVDVTKNLLWNYTGLIANKLSERYSRAAFVYCRNGNVVQASVRDIFSRDFLSLFVLLCDAHGHNPAFGMKIKIFDLNELLQKLERLDKKLAMSNMTNEPVVIRYKYMTPDSSMIEDIALLNEFASTNVPVVLLQKQLVGDMREYKTEYNYKYRWGDYDIQSQNAQSFGSWLLVRPTKGIKTKLIVQ